MHILNSDSKDADFGPIDRTSDSSNNINKQPSPQQSPKSTTIPKNSEKISIAPWKMIAILSLIATMVTYAETMLIPAIPVL